MDLEEWFEYRCYRCGLVVDCDRCEPHEDPEVEQDCDISLIRGVMES